MPYSTTLNCWTWDNHGMIILYLTERIAAQTNVALARQGWNIYHFTSLYSCHQLVKTMPTQCDVSAVSRIILLVVVRVCYIIEAPLC